MCEYNVCIKVTAFSRESTTENLTEINSAQWWHGGHQVTKSSLSRKNYDNHCMLHSDAMLGVLEVRELGTAREIETDKILISGS